MAQQFIRYAGAGAVGTAVHYVILIALVQLAGAGSVAASTAGAIMGALVNYALNRRYTFASRREHRHALPRFFAVAGAGVLLNAAVLAVLVAAIPVHYLALQLVATGTVLGAGFAANRRWTF
jgi:putative flippase GtrA